MRILIADDDPVQLDALHQHLKKLYQIDTARSGQEALGLIKLGSYDLLLLDVHMPGLDGIALCRRLRTERCTTPILLVTASDSSRERIDGLNAGADDYISKPLDLEELLARLQALLRRGSVMPRSKLEFGELELDLSQRTVSFKGTRVPLTPREYTLLELLMRYPGRVFTRSELVSRLWGWDNQPMEDSVKAHVKGLRQKLEKAGITNWVENVYGIGYRLIPAEQLAHRSTDSSSLMTASSPLNVEKQLAAIWTEYQPLMQHRLAVLRQAVDALANHALEEVLREQAATAAHHLAGTLGLFRRDAGTEPARCMESAFRDTSEQSIEALRSHLAVLDKLIAPASAATKSSATTIDAQRNRILSKIEHLLGRQPVILAVDDDPIVLAAVEALLAPWNMRVTATPQANDLEALISHNLPDLLLLDVELPNTSGISICETLRARVELKDLPIVFLTRHTDADTVSRLYDAGADDYIAKPLHADELVSRIVNSLEKNRLLRQLMTRDPATSLANQRESARAIDAVVQSQPEPSTLVILSVTNLVHIRRELGHEWARDVLRRVGSWVQELLPVNTLCGYWGSGEFVFFFPGCLRGEALLHMQSLAMRFRTEIFYFGDAGTCLLNTSLSTAETDNQTRSATALYRAAATGRGA